MELFGIDVLPCNSTVIVILIIAAILILIKYWISTGTCHSVARLDGKTVIITGANSGIGKETALEIARRGAHVILACRNTENGDAAAKDVRLVTGNSQVKFVQLDLASFSSVREFAKKILNSEPQIHILINNAGLATTPYQQTEDGYEMQFGVNHLGHFLLTLLLLERIIQSSPARIVNLSSMAYKGGKIHFNDINMEKKYNPFMAYFRSKLANVLFTRELAKYLQGTGVTTYSVHPGIVRTNLPRYLGKSTNIFLYWLFYIFSFLYNSAKQGAQTTIYCSVAEELEEESGHYYSNCRRTKLDPHATDDAVAQKLWELSERLTGIKIANLNLSKL